MLSNQETHPNRPMLPTAPIPITVLPTQTSIESEAHSLSHLPASLPASLPARCRNEPAVVGCATGEVRRVRSVLDMKLGAMAISIDAHLAPPDPVSWLLHEQEKANFEHVQPLEPPTSPAQLFDAFGIAIPQSTQIKMQRDGLAEPIYGESGDAFDYFSFPTSYTNEAGCSVILAESPSRLDLSALLC